MASDAYMEEGLLAPPPLPLSRTISSSSSSGLDEEALLQRAADGGVNVNNNRVHPNMPSRRDMLKKDIMGFVADDDNTPNNNNNAQKTSSTVFLDHIIKDELPPATENPVSQNFVDVRSLLGGGGYEEEIELEFQQAAQELDNHGYALCPKCKAPITKVLVRRRRPPQEPVPNPPPPDVGCWEQVRACLSCLINGIKGCPPPPPSYFPEIVKSIVYGGLAESITSLSLVSSAAASGATTLNIEALGMANLIGGLFIIGQNLLDLKRDQQEERYKEALGRKDNFLLHAAFAILSYLVFGLIPPVVYGFTFRDTDDKVYKLLAVAAASFICIIIIAIGKAYSAQGQQNHKFTTYLKTVLLYVTTAVMASGVAYAAGDQAKKFLEKYGWLKPNVASTLLFPGEQTSHYLSYASH